MVFAVERGRHGIMVCKVGRLVVKIVGVLLFDCQSEFGAKPVASVWK